MRTPENAFKLYGNMVYRLALARTGNQHDGEDLLQEVFVRYIRFAPVFESEEHRKAWLIHITINCAKSLKTSPWKTRNVSMESMDPEDFPDGMDGVDTADEGADVYQAVLSLPVKYRTVVHLFYYEELSTGEIAKAMDCKETTVRSLLSRARKKLSKLLKGETW